ncbi:hypothetical protein ACFX2J_007147 [Malus domestica]
MGRVVSRSGGQSSLNYLFGIGKVPKPATNNYIRADSQNIRNFITDRPLTKVHADSVVENWVLTGERPLRLAHGADKEVYVVDAEKGLGGDPVVREQN